MILASNVVASNSWLWYATRATGVIALILLTGSVVLGIVVQVRAASRRWPRLVTLGVHRNLSLLVLAFLALHILTAVVDSYAPVGWLSVIVPFASSYRPLWLGFGTVAFDLLIAVTITSLLRTRISARLWRLVHWAAYACWPSAVIHSLGTGSDARQPFVLGVTIACVAAVILAGGRRLVSGWPEHAVARVVAGVTAAVVVIVGLVWTVTGPLRPGWASRSGTPAVLLARVQAPASGASAQTSQLPTLPFSTNVSGTTRTASSNSGTSTVTLNGRGADPVVFQVVISGPAASGGGVQMTSSQVSFGPTSSPQQYTGQVSALNGGSIQATVTDSGGSRITLSLDLSLPGTALSGSLSASAS
ncbi:ferric reductase-like transmembrane domain-containing protein [Catenulispora sp. NF23]|uniref:Ferric reductase-like transmembrane domain-containing protein n=1 Tax=Catenulispora pinistramenti TaxID=2705254 RepID=A0ABS5L6P4_9ACTN|nr:ferric reductase-like transmembrane domain-containing protein [Catenulispora pinistramenti]MBS2538618.1 ferric reductase-like transmembrane domain-containing protein [Catenulispora pinistramenti]MBS2554015.1 ferric reductase-like transmembrane domain-containing protein [Catenulispora pinistramenti]